MKILMFNYEYPPLGGGGGVVHQHIAEELARRHEVQLVTSGYRELPEVEVRAGVTIHRVPVWGRKSLATASVPSMLSYFPASLRRGQRIIERFAPDLINTHFAVPTGPSSVMLARRNRIPHALCIHGGDIFDPSKWLSPHRTPGLRGTVRWVLRRSDRVLAQSRNTAENAQRIYGAPERITIVPHGLQEPILPPYYRRDLGLQREQVVLVTVGRLVARKANHQLIEIVAQLNDPRVVLVILGDGPEQERLQQRASELGIADRVHLPGFVSEVEKLQYLQAADIFVSSSLHEGFGLMFLEAMFCRLPIVAYDHGGQRDFLEQGKTGFLVPLNDRESFRRSLQRLIDQPEWCSRIGRHNLALSQQFTIQHCASRYEQVFEEMVYGKRTPTHSSGVLPEAIR